MLEPRGVNRRWDELCDAAGVPHFRIHDLRHAAASFLFAEGADMKTIQTMLRHTRQSTTSDIYTHVYEEVQRKTADTMEGVLTGLTAKPRRKRTAS